MLSIMEIAKRREKTRHSGIPGFQQYCKSKSQININNNWKNNQQQTNQEQQQTTTEETISIQQQRPINIQQQQTTIIIQQQQQETTTEETINIQQQQTISKQLQQQAICIQQQQTISMQQQQQQTISIQQQKCIMTEESYDDVSYMLDSFESMADGYPCITNNLKGDDSLAKYVKRLKDISFYHGCNQESTMETLELAKFKLEHLKELQSRNIITTTMKKIKEKFGKIFCQ
jgi:hypothetical protein